MKRSSLEREGAPARLFTLDEAHGVVCDIEPLVAEIKSLFSRIRREIAETSEATGIPAGNDRISQHLEARGLAPALITRINQLVRTIHERGCVVNGPEAGLVDFPALLGSEIVFLCWKHGEKKIGHWHRIPDGFAGRRPLLDFDDSGEDASAVH